MKKLTNFRYYLEIISVPVFAFLIIHLAGHGLMLLADPDHSHGHHAEHHEESVADEHHEEGEHLDEAHDEYEGENTEEDHEDEHHDQAHELDEVAHDEHAGHGHGEGLSLEYLLSTEVLGGVLALILFVWLWHLPWLKPLVPCSHDNCDHKTVWPHLAAMVAFAFHWFPESQIRYELLKDFSAVNWLDIAAVIGFSAHFLVDTIILILLASFWPQLWQRLTAGITLAVLWVLSFWVGHNGGIQLEGVTEPIILLISAFLLAIFVHKPHKPEPQCTTCK